MILDSCFLIDLMANDESAVAKLDELVETATPTSVSTLTVTEVGSGLRDESERDEFDGILDRVDLIPFGVAESRRAAHLQRRLRSEGHPVGAIDVMIAATALEHGTGVVTRNVSEFRRIDGVRVSPY
ncbi:PIN domain-containing protein [Halorussus salilacus]|uniref:PIN domain-containing protein n=1 Tax=Halorussus salilacus TaxID=2953750 RepID=UPI0020A0B5EC|nr:PIN domain-containing protein [Halorussus salilacus]USZ67180.1 PIN domain-containing protein [Halorussus salilacus]